MESGILGPPRRPSTVSVVEAKPLFARSVEQADIRRGWPSGRLDVPHYAPMVELLTLGANSSGLSQESKGKAQATVARERRETRRSKRSQPKRPSDEDESVSALDAYARGDQEGARRGSRLDNRAREEAAEQRARSGRREADPRNERRGGQESLPLFRMFGGLEGR